VRGDQAQTVGELVDALEDSEEVQQVSSNFEISEDIMQRLTA
jgi:transcriptional/translational regulatory protein YebC/TACO1